MRSGALFCALLRSFLPALLQKLVGEFFYFGEEIWREFCGIFFGPTKTKAQKIRGKFRSIFS